MYCGDFIPPNYGLYGLTSDNFKNANINECRLNADSIHNSVAKFAQLYCSGSVHDCVAHSSGYQSLNDATLYCEGMNNSNNNCRFECQATDGCIGSSMYCYNTNSTCESTGQYKERINIITGSLSPTTQQPSTTPTKSPTHMETNTPTNGPTIYPSIIPSKTPTEIPTNIPTLEPTIYPSVIPTKLTETPSASPVHLPTEFIAQTTTNIVSETQTPSQMPTQLPTHTKIATTIALNNNILLCDCKNTSTNTNSDSKSTFTSINLSQGMYMFIGFVIGVLLTACICSCSFISQKIMQKLVASKIENISRNITNIVDINIHENKPQEQPKPIKIHRISVSKVERKSYPETAMAKASYYIDNLKPKSKLDKIFDVIKAGELTPSGPSQRSGEMSNMSSKIGEISSKSGDLSKLSSGV